jgi:AraC-like DNA-binding protein
LHGEVSHNICISGQLADPLGVVSMSGRPSTSATAATEAEPATIRAFFLAPLVRELANSGVPLDGFLRRYGLSAAQLTSLYERVPLRNFVAIAEDAATRLNRPFLGLELGEKFTLADLGPFYAMFVFAPNLLTALQYLARFQSAWQTNTVLEFVPGSRTSACRYSIQDPTIWPRRQDAEFALASFTSFIRQLTNRRWRPLAVEFEHDVTERAQVLSEFFHAPVRGNCESNQLIMGSSSLAAPLRWRMDTAEHDVAAIVERHLLELFNPPDPVTETLTERTAALISRRIGRCIVTIDVIAAELNMSVRSLRRHLTHEGSSFRQILQVHRRKTIEAVLRSDGGRLSDLAGRLSYSDSAVLSRAFKTWTGMSPREYARSQKRRS